MRAFVRLHFAVVSGFILSSVTLAQNSSSPAWGTTSESSEVISVWDMEIGNSNETWTGNGTFAQRYATNGGTFFSALHVPQGAVLDYILLDGCDDSDTGSVEAGITKITLGSPLGLVGINSGVAAAEGCSRWRADLLSPETIDNENNDYEVYALNSTPNGETRIASVRVYYHLQVSPAPAQATFGDVPTNHPFFQYVEALAASGITAGCGNGNFCPDAPLTRGQMAVFLSKALGLHWPVESGTN